MTPGRVSRGACLIPCLSVGILPLKAPCPTSYRTIPWCSLALDYCHEGNSNPIAYIAWVTPLSWVGTYVSCIKKNKENEEGRGGEGRDYYGNELMKCFYKNQINRQCLAATGWWITKLHVRLCQDNCRPIL